MEWDKFPLKSIVPPKGLGSSFYINTSLKLKTGHYLRKYLAKYIFLITLFLYTLRVFFNENDHIPAE